MSDEDISKESPATGVVSEESLVDDMTEYNFKILVIGNVGVGKTCLIRRYVEGVFTENSKMTIGVDFALKVIQWNKNTRLSLQLWDVAGQERFSGMTRVYFRDALGVLVVFDATRADTFEAVERWKADLDSKVSLPMPNGMERPIPAVLIANKIDLLSPSSEAGSLALPIPLSSSLPQASSSSPFVQSTPTSTSLSSTPSQHSTSAFGSTPPSASSLSSSSSHAPPSTSSAKSWAAGIPQGAKLDDYCREHDFMDWFESSSKDEALSKNIDKAMRTLAGDILHYITTYGDLQRSCNAHGSLSSLSPASSGGCCS